MRAGRIKRSLLSDASGATAIEFAIVAVPLFVIFMAILETAMILLGELSIESATERTARDIMVDSERPWHEQSAVREAFCGHVSVVLDCERLQLDLRSLRTYAELPPPIAVRDGAVDTSGFGNSFDKEKPLIVVRAVYEWPILLDPVRSYLSTLSNGSHLLTATGVAQIEAF